MAPKIPAATPACLPKPTIDNITPRRKPITIAVIKLHAIALQVKAHHIDSASLVVNLLILLLSM